MSGVRYDSFVISQKGVPVSGASIYIGTSTAAGVPLSPLVSIYSDQALSTLTSNPLAADSNGNFGFWVAVGTYLLQISGVGIATPYNATISVGSLGVGAGFDTIASGTNTSAAMRVGSGASLSATGSGSITATTVPASALPNPTSTTLGGVKSLAAVSHQFLTTIGTDGSVSQAQPAFSDISGSVAAAQLPNPSSTTLGGVKSKASVASNFLTQIGTDGSVSQAQPAFSDISGSATGAQLPLPAVATKGGVFSKAAVSHQFLTSISSVDGSIGQAQPAFSDLTGSATGAQLPLPAVATLGGVFSKAVVSHQFLTGISSADGSVSQAQPAFSDLSGSATGAQLPLPAVATLGGVFSKAAASNQFLTSISSVDGSVGQAQPAASNLSNGVSGSGAVVLNTAPTITGQTTMAGITASSSVAYTTATANVGVAAFSAFYVLKDLTNGGTAVVFVDNTGSITIISQTGTTVFAVTSTPTAAQLGLQVAATILNVKGGSSRTSGTMNFFQLVVA